MKNFIKSLLPKSFLDARSERIRKRYATRRFLENPSGNYYSIDCFDHYKCIFVHIPKAAGVSVNKALFGNLAGGHQTIQDYERIYSEETFNEYFKFTIVRDPIDRFISAFNFLKAGGFDERDAKWANENLSAYSDINEFIDSWINDRSIYLKNHFMPQIYFLKNSEGKVQLDFIGKLENINKDFEVIKNQLGIKTVLKKNNTTKKKTSTELSKESIKKLRNLYIEDFQLLGY